MPSLNLAAVGDDQLKTLYREVMREQDWRVELTRGGHVKVTNPEGRSVFGPTTTSDGARAAKNMKRQLKLIGWPPQVEEKKGDQVRKFPPKVHVAENAVITVPEPPTPTFQHGVLEYEKKEPVVDAVTEEVPKKERKDFIPRGEIGGWAEDVRSLTNGLRVEEPPKQRPRGLHAVMKKQEKRGPKPSRARLLTEDLLLKIAVDHPDSWVKVPGKHPIQFRGMLARIAKELDLTVKVREVMPGAVPRAQLSREEQQVIKSKWYVKVVSSEPE